MTRFKIIFFFILFSCQDSSPSRPPIESPPLQVAYRPLLSPEAQPQLPDVSLRCNLVLQDKPVEKILISLAKMADFPLAFDEEAARRARQVHVTFVAHDAPLETLLNFCARALDTHITWWPNSPLVWVGNSPPPLDKEKAFRVWELGKWLSEFQILSPPQVITKKVDDSQMSHEVIQLKKSIVRENEAHPPLPPLLSYLSDDPFITFFSEALGDSSSIETHQTNYDLLNSLTISQDATSFSSQPLIRFLDEDEALAPLKESLQAEEFQNWAQNFSQFVYCHPDIKKFSNTLNSSDFQNWAKDLEDLEFIPTTLVSHSKDVRLQLYKKYEIYRKTSLYLDLSKERSKKIHAPISQFVKTREARFEKIKRQLAVSQLRESMQFKRYHEKKEQESKRLVKLIDKIAGSPLDLQLIDHGDLLISSNTKPQNFIIDQLLKNLSQPQTLSIDLIINQYEEETQATMKAFTHLVDNNLRAIPLDLVLMRWALEAKVTLCWVVSELPHAGQALINRQHGLLPFDQSLESLARQYKFPPILDEGQRCLWIGVEDGYRFRHPHPSSIQVIKVPSSLAAYSAEYLADYFNTVLTRQAGFIASAPPDYLIYLLPTATKNQFLHQLASAAREGKLAQSTSLQNDSNQ